MPDVWTTHLVELLPDQVVKRYRAGHESEYEREWRALALLRKHAPGLAPTPLHPADDRNPPDTPLRQADRLRRALS